MKESPGFGSRGGTAGPFRQAQGRLSARAEAPNKPQKRRLSGPRSALGRDDKSRLGAEALGRDHKSRRGIDTL